MSDAESKDRNMYWDTIREYARREQKGEHFPECSYSALVEMNDVAYPKVKKLFDDALAENGLGYLAEFAVIRQQFSTMTFWLEVPTSNAEIIKNVRAAVESYTPIKYRITATRWAP